jgi:hypothetical protein
MDITDVKAKVDGHISADDILTLRYQNNDLKSAAIDSVIHTYFAGTLSGKIQRVNGQTAVVDKARQQAIYSLSLSVQNFSLYQNASPVQAQITFSSKDPVVQCSIKATLPQGYSLADSFTEFRKQPHLSINQIKLENSAITLRSGTNPASYFESNLLPVGPLKQVAWLLDKKLPLTGSIDSQAEGDRHFPIINLETPNLAPLSLGIFKLDIRVRLRSVVQSLPNHKRAYVSLSYVELVTEFKTPKLNLPVVLPLQGEGQYLMSLYLDLAKPRPPIKSLNTLSGFTGSDPKQLLNPELPLGKATLSLDSLSAVLDPYARQLVNLEIGVSLELKWTIITNTLELEKIGAVFSIDDPTHPKLENISALLFAELKVGSVSLDTSILLPDRTLQAQLAPGSKIDVNEVIGTFARGLKLPGNDSLTIYQLDVFAHVKKGEDAYSLEAGAGGTLTIIKGLTLDQIHFFIAYQSQAVSEVSLSSTLRLTNIQVDLFLLAEYATESGWQFEGGTGSGQAIPIGNLIKDLGELFGEVSLPAAIEKLSIKDLKTSFNTKTKDFHFNIEADFGKDVAIILTFSNLNQAGATPPTFEKRATGVIKVFPGKPNEFAFDLGIDLKPDSKHFVALYNNTAGNGINLKDLVKAMVPAADLPSELPDFSITIKDAIVGYVSDKQGNKTVSQSIFALDMGASLDLTSLGDIPLIGKSLSAAKTLKLAFQLVYPAVARGKTFAKADLAALNELITVAGPSFPTDQNLSALLVKTELRIGDGNPIDFKLPVTINPTTGQLENNANANANNNTNTFPTPPGAQATDDGVKWFQLNKQFGPVHLQRAGFKFDKGEVTALLDGGLAALGLEVDLMGLSVTSKITDVKDGEFHPRFGLQGLGLSFSKGGVGLAGALLRLEVTRDGQTVYEYDGLASVEAEGIRLAAIGSLTKVNGHTSLFLFAVLDYPLGGEPFFYVTGLAGGFGLNQKLTMPTVDQVSTFPLVQAALNPPQVPTDAGSAGSFITAEMQKLQTYLTPSVGQYFGCAGIRFNSFELLDSFVLVSISFGREFELDLLGVSTLVVPPELPPSEPALAKVSLQIVASFIPNEGLAIVQGRLTADSHILDPNCHLTGGFAFATWFGPNPNAGDFVITLGGYHPDFQKPDHYPTVPRVGVNWQILPRQGVSGGSQLSVTGGLYFALTPRALMAGGAMHAVFQTSLDLGIATVDVKAWFILGADFIVYWKPFHYSAHLYIDIGINVVIHFLGTHELDFDASADLQVWGPAFGGHAHVFIKVIGIKIGFDVDFGAAAPKPPPLKWDDKDDASKSFRKSFLPPDDKIVSVAIGAGLVRKVDIGKEGQGGGGLTASGDEKRSDVWYVINASDFCVRTSSVIPIKECVTTIPGPGKKTLRSGFAGNTDFGIASMGKDRDKVKTSHRITVKRDGPAESQFVAHPIHSHVPGGLWAENNSADINAELLIERAVVGFKIVPAKTSVSGHTQPIKRDCLTYTTHDLSNAYADHAIATFTATGSNPGDDPAANRALWDSIQGEIHSNTTRDAMLAAMGFADADFDIGEPFSTDAAYAPSYGSLGR